MRRGNEIVRAERPFAHDRGPNQVPALILEVVHAPVEEETVVPHDHRVLPPLHAAVLVKMLREALKILEQRAALRLTPADEAFEIGGGREQRLPAGFGMRADRRMDILE